MVQCSAVRVINNYLFLRIADSSMDVVSFLVIVHLPMQ